MKEKDEAYDLNGIISNVLKYGVVISAALVLAGLVLTVVEKPAGLPTNVGQLVSSDYGKPTLSISSLLSGVAQGAPVFIIQLGLVVLLATPVARVVASVLVFSVERDRTYVVITLVVLSILLFSVFVVGPAESRST